MKRKIIRLATSLWLCAQSVSSVAAQSVVAPTTANVAAADGTPQPTAPTVEPALMPSWGSLFGELPGDARHLPSRAHALWLGGAGALAAAVHGRDATLTRKAAASPGLDTALEAGAVLGGGVVQIGSAFGTFAIGRLTGHPIVASVGSELARAQIINTVLTQGLKISVGRRRPDGSRFSFPSGHASATFATAAVLERRFGWRVGAPAYALGAYVGASRLQENRHYLSDVLFGAAIGIVSGRAATARLGHHAFAVVPMAVPGGAALSVMRIER